MILTVIQFVVYIRSLCLIAEQCSAVWIYHSRLGDATSFIPPAGGACLDCSRCLVTVHNAALNIPVEVLYGPCIFSSLGST